MSSSADTGAINPEADGAAVFVANTSTYDAFPGAARLATGDLITVYFQGGSHTDAAAVLVKRLSSDDGDTWGSATTIVAAGTPRNRGADVTVLSTGRVVVTYWTWDGTGGVDSAVPYVIYSDDNAASWSSPIEITNSFTLWAAVQCPVIELANGDVLVAMYGRDTGDTFSSIRVSKSTDGVATWAHLADIVDGPTSSREFAEPNLCRLDNDDILCMIRSDTGTDTLYGTTSTDDGATWPAPTARFPGTGKPAIAQRASDGLVVCQFRQNGTGDHRMRASNDRGVTWAASDGDFTSAATLTSLYGAWVALASGQLAAVYSLESSTTDADTRFVKIVGGS